MKFNTNKRLLIIAVSLSSAFSMVGCLSAQGKTNIETSYNMESSSESDISQSTSFASTETSESLSEPSSFEDYFEKTLPSNKISLKDVDMSDFTLNQLYFGGVGMGYGNPKLLSFVRTYFKNNTLNTVDVPYYESTGHNYDDVLVSFQESVDIDYIRYVLEENSLKFWVDEIPTEFFKEKFPDYYNLVNNTGNGYVITEDEYFNYFVRNSASNGYNGNLSDFSSSGKNEEKLKEACFIQLMYYNQHREKLASNISDNDDGKIKYGFIESGVTEDGKWVWCPTELQYRVVQNDTKHLPKCKNIDIKISETREDLIASGIDIEKYDEMCEKVFGGAKMEKNKTQDDQSRSRQG